MTEPLAPLRDQAWDLPGLVAIAGTLLAPLGRTGPDERTVRWYQTSGIVARPARYEGRTAMYGYLHLLQVLAVRVWQAEGHSLARIQGALVGLGVAELEAALVARFRVSQEGAAASSAPVGLNMIQLQPGQTLTLAPGVPPRVEPAATIAVLPEPSSPEGAPPIAPTVPPPMPPPAAPPRPLAATGPPAPPGWQVHELRPGVLVLIDPRLVSDPAQLVQHLLLTLSESP